jgi:predicted acyltransferase
VFGTSAIVAYVAPFLVKLWVLQRWYVGHGSVSLQQWWLDLVKGHLGPIAGGCVYTFLYIAAWWVVLWQMYRRKLFVRV